MAGNSQSQAEAVARELCEDLNNQSRTDCAKVDRVVPSWGPSLDRSSLFDALSKNLEEISRRTGMSPLGILIELRRRGSLMLSR